MKGYELYSWQEDGQWQFTLITGTNRNKTLEEITSHTPLVPGDGWVNIHVTGCEAIKKVLSRLPEGEPVFWLGSMREAQPSKTTVNITLPDTATINSIKDYAAQIKIDLSAFTPVPH